MSGALMLMRFALRGVLRHWRRSLLTGAALAGGIVVLVVLAGLQDGYVAGRLEDGLGLQLGHLRVKGGTRPLPDPLALADAFVSDGTAVAAAPRFRQPALIAVGSKAQGTLVLGVDPQREAQLARLPSLVDEGSFLPDGSGQPPIVLGHELAATLGVGLGESLVLSLRRTDGSLATSGFRVSGLFAAGGGATEAGVAIVRREALALLLQRTDGADEVAVRLADPWRAPDLAARLAARPEFEGLVVESWHEMAPEIAQAMELLGAMEKIRTAILFALVALGIYTTLTLALAARRREFGMLLALGLAPSRLMAVLVLELLLVVVAAAVVGIVVAAGLIAWLHARGLDLASLGARLPGALEGAAIVRPLFSAARARSAIEWAAAIAFVVLLVPAVRVLLTDPAEVLRERD